MPPHPVPGWKVFGSARCDVASVGDARNVVLTRSARSALVLALRLADVGPQAQVLVPNYYCPTMLAPIEHARALPIFYPIGDDALPDMGWLRAHVTPRWKALLAAHFFGLPVPMEALRSFCDENGMVLIEDCAHAFFGELVDTPVGSTGHYAIASLPKFFPVIEGGVLVGNGRSLGDPLPSVRPIAQLKGAWNVLETAAANGGIAGLNVLVRALSGALSALRGRAADTNTELAPLPEAVRETALADPLLIPMRLRVADEWIFRHAQRQRIVTLRRRHYEQLGALLSGVPGVTPLFPQLPSRAVPYVFPVWLQEPDRTYARMRALGLPVLRWDRYWPGAIDSLSDLGRSWGHHVIQITCHQDLTANDVETVAETLIGESGPHPSGVGR